MWVVCSAGVDIEYRGDWSVLVEPSTTVQKAGQLILVQSKHRQARMSKLLRPTVTFSRRCFQARAVSSGSLNAWHHGPDSLSMPAVNPEAVTLVNMRFCPYAQRTALCLNAKNIEYDVINSQLMTKPRWLWEINPIGKVPVLIHDGNTIYESLVTCEYIEVRGLSLKHRKTHHVIVGSVSWQKVALRLGRAESERQDVGGAL